MTCPSCGAPLCLTENDDSWRCEYCRATYMPDNTGDGVRLLGEPSPLACPVCAVPLEQAALAGRRILACARCRGILIGMEEFVAILDELRAKRSGPGGVQTAADRRGFERHIDCPQCHHPMDTHFYEGGGNIIIDDCSRCLLNWLDQGELMRVVLAPGREYPEETYAGQR